MYIAFRCVMVAGWLGVTGLGYLGWTGLEAMRSAILANAQALAVQPAQSYVPVSGYVYAVAAIQHPDARPVRIDPLAFAAAAVKDRVETVLGELRGDGSQAESPGAPSAS